MRKTGTIRVVVAATLLLVPLPVGCDSGGPSTPSPPRSSDAGAGLTGPAPAPKVLPQGKAKRVRAPTGAAPASATD